MIRFWIFSFLQYTKKKIPSLLIPLSQAACEFPKSTNLLRLVLPLSAKTDSNGISICDSSINKGKKDGKRHQSGKADFKRDS